jgi:phage gpG-like protein
MSVTIKLELTERSQRLLRQYPSNFRKKFREGMRQAMLHAESKSKKSFNKPGNLHVRTGHLRRSIESSIRDRRSEIIGVISSNVKYANVHEFGATITPKTGTYLKFKTIGGGWVTTKEVVIPARPFLKPAITDNMEHIQDIIEKKILELNR